MRSLGLWLAVTVTLAFLTKWGPEWFHTVPGFLLIPLSDWVGAGLTWFAREADIFGIAIQQITRGIAEFFNKPIKWAIVALADGIVGGRGLNRTQVIPPLPWVSVGGLMVLLAYRFGGIRLSATALLAVGFLVTFGLWHNAMVTLASVLASVAVAIVVGLFLGIWSYRNEKVEDVTRAIMNVMQTVPIFAYLVPTLLLFGYGPSAALIATVLYALPPMVHNTVLALKSIPPETIQCGEISGCTQRQLMRWVQLPSALPKLAVGINQAIMMTLNMVIIASMIGAGGLGFDVLVALRKLDIGSGLEAGLGIVALAVILDRISQAAALRASQGVFRGKHQRHLWQICLGWIIATTAIAQFIPVLQFWPDSLVLSTADYWNQWVSWINLEFYDSLNKVRTVLLLEIMRPLRDTLAATPWLLVVSIITIFGLILGGLKLGVLVSFYMLFIVVTGYWDPAMNSVYLIIISVSLALLIGFPLGFCFALTPRLQPGINLFLDTLQTLPTLVYLLPAVMLFRIGDVSAVIAVTSYALATAIRYAMVGLNQIPPARIEAAQMAGCKPWQTFLWVRLPAAFPTLILGINQTIMMAFSMLIIAALVGTKDLGQQVLIALNRSIVGQGIVAGLCVACIALVADALLKKWSARIAGKSNL